MSEYTLENSHLKLVIDPEKGSSIMSCFIKKSNEWVSLMPNSGSDTVDLNASSFLMIPYSNRIKDGKFNFNKQSYQLNNSENNSIHGDVRKRPWKVTSVETDSIICSFNSNKFDKINWPWPFKATVQYSLIDNIFSSTITIHNMGKTPMPVGCGWHPYFNRSLTLNNEPVFFEFKADGVYPDINNTCMPSGPASKPVGIKDFTERKALDPNCMLDLCYENYDGRGYIHWPESGVKVSFDCSSECSHLIIYNPPKSYFAVEPVTNANNGVNLLSQDSYNSGVISIDKNQKLEATFSFKVDIEK